MTLRQEITKYFAVHGILTVLDNHISEKLSYFCSPRFVISGIACVTDVTKAVVQLIVITPVPVTMAKLLNRDNF